MSILFQIFFHSASLSFRIDEKEPTERTKFLLNLRGSFLSSGFDVDIATTFSIDSSTPSFKTMLKAESTKPGNILWLIFTFSKMPLL